MYGHFCLSTLSFLHDCRPLQRRMDPVYKTVSYHLTQPINFTSKNKRKNTVYLGCLQSLSAIYFDFDLRARRKFTNDPFNRAIVSCPECGSYKILRCKISPGDLSGDSHGKLGPVQIRSRERMPPSSLSAAKHSGTQGTAFIGCLASPFCRAQITPVPMTFF